MCVCVPPGGERESGRNSGPCVSKFTTFRMQKEFPADYTEVKHVGADKRKKTAKQASAPHRANPQR